MTDIQINGTEQILAGSITDVSISSSAGIAQDKLARASAILLSDGSVVMAAALNLGSYQINDLASGTASTDAVNLGQVESLIAAGVSSYVDKGAWSSGTAYVVNNLVQLAGTVYNCIAANTGENPATSPTYWNLWVASGTRGSLISVGAGAPSTITGQTNGDLYINTADGELYQLVSGAWTVMFNLTGPAGAAGATGTRGSLLYVEAGAPGTVAGQLNGDCYIDSATGYFYQLAAGTWTYEFALTGGGSGGITALTGDVTASGTGSVAATLADSGVTAGSYSNANITVDAKGRVTAAASGSGGGGGGGSLPTDYISGLQLIYDSTTTFQVATGSAYVPAASGVVTVSSVLSSSPTRSYSTWYYVYLDGSGALVVSSTAPATNYQGTAWEDGSGNRYLGAILTDSSGLYYKFQVSGGKTFWLTNTQLAPFLVLNNGTATTATDVACGYSVPSTARMAEVAFKPASGVACYVGTPGGFTPTSTTGELEIGGAVPVVMTADRPLDQYQNFSYCTAGAGDGLTAWVLGYVDQR